MSTPNHAPDLAKTLHDQFCRSTSWETAEGAADHVKRAWVSRARTILNAPDPAVELHDTVACDPVADPTFPDGCGPDRDRHVQFCLDWLTRQGFLPGDTQVDTQLVIPELDQDTPTGTDTAGLIGAGTHRTAS